MEAGPRYNKSLISDNPQIPNLKLMTLVFCFKTIFRNSHRQIFGLDKLLEEGHKVILLDLSEIYGGNPTSDDELMLRLRKKINDKKDLEAFRDSLNPDPVIYICNDTYLMPVKSAFEIIKRKQDRLLAFKIKPTPFLSKPETGAKLAIKKLVQKLDFLPFHLFKPVYAATHNYYIPDYYMCNTYYNLPPKVQLTVKNENILITHSDDCNKIILDKTPMQDKERIGVFLDQILPIAYKNEPREYFENYYADISKTLNALKAKFNLDKIVVAEHPESVAVAEELKDKYQGFERVRGGSQRLVKDATYVFAHYSTSIGLAVYYEKPVVLINGKNLRKVEHIGVAIKSYEKQLNLPVVEMEKRDLSHLTNYEIDKKLYRLYVKKYLKDSTVEESSYHYAINRIISDINKEKN